MRSDITETSLHYSVSKLMELPYFKDKPCSDFELLDALTRLCVLLRDAQDYFSSDECGNLISSVAKGNFWWVPEAQEYIEARFTKRHQMSAIFALWYDNYVRSVFHSIRKSIKCGEPIYATVMDKRGKRFVGYKEYTLKADGWEGAKGSYRKAPQNDYDIIRNY